MTTISLRSGRSRTPTRPAAGLSWSAAWPSAGERTGRIRARRSGSSWPSDWAEHGLPLWIGRSASGLEQYLDGAGAPRVLQRQHRLVPALERESVRDDRRQVEAAGHEVEVVLHGVLGDAVHLLDAEPVRPDDAQLLEVKGGPLEALRRLDAGDDERAAGRKQPERGLDGLGRADRVVDDRRAVLQPVALAPRLERRRAGAARDLGDELVGRGGQHGVSAEADGGRAPC